MDFCKIVDFTYLRRFGVEIELNSFDGRDFKEFPLDRFSNEMPVGIQQVASTVLGAARTNVIIDKWHHTHYNTEWVVKPDSSCGMEVCSPIEKGKYGIEEVCAVIDALAENPRITADDRCSLHIHADMVDCSFEEIAAVIAWWVKCESVFLDSVPSSRKRNRYCQFIGICDLFQHNTSMNPGLIIGKLGKHKYYTINAYHLNKGNRQTLEFRTADSEFCMNSYYAENWIKLVIHFIECAVTKGLPEPFKDGNPWTSFLWLDPKDVMKFLDFTDSELSSEMETTRNWFLASMCNNLAKEKLPGIWSEIVRKNARMQLEEIVKEIGMNWKSILRFLKPI